MKTHPLKHRQDRRREEIRGGYTQSNTSNNSMKTHRLKHIDMIGGEKRDVVTRRLKHQIIYNSMKTHLLKHTHDRRREEISGGYSQPNTSNNSIKTHLLEHRHDRKKEKRYVVVTHSLIHLTIQ